MPRVVAVAAVEVSIVLGEHVDVVEDEAVEVAARSDLCEPDVHRHRLVEDRQRLALCEYNKTWKFPCKTPPSQFIVVNKL